MNLDLSDIENDVFTGTLTTDNKENDIDLSNLDDDFFFLPSQRKQMMNKEKPKGQKRRRPPKQQHLLTLDQILDSDNAQDLFQMSDDESKSNQETKKKEELDNIQQNAKPAKTAANTEKPKTQPTLPTPKQEVPNLEINNIETSLINYITTAVYSIRESFVKELKSMLDTSEKEESIINDFILSLPSEIDELVASEAQFLNESSFSSTRSTSILSNIDFQLEPLKHIVPRVSGNAKKKTTIESIQDLVLNANISMNETYDKLFNELQEEIDVLSTSREHSFITDDKMRNTDPNVILAIEVEADSTRLDVEKQFLDFRNKRLANMKQYWNDCQLNSYGTSDKAEILKRLQAFSRKIPNSKYQNAISALSSLSQNFQQAAQEIDILQEIANYEIGLIYQNNQNSKSKKHKRKTEPENHSDDLNDEEVNYDYKKKPSSARKNEKQFHSARESCSSRGSRESSFASQIEDKLSSYRKQRTKHNNYIQAEQEYDEN